MTEDSHPEPDSAYQRVPRKEYVVTPSTPKAFMVEDAQWERIHSRVAGLESKGSIDWLMAASTAVGGVGASAGLALLVLPTATNEAQLGPAVKPVLWAVLVGGVFLAVVTGLLWKHLRDEKGEIASDICHEMKTIQEAWQERESADASG